LYSSFTRREVFPFLIKEKEEGTGIFLNILVFGLKSNGFEGVCQYLEKFADTLLFRSFKIEYFSFWVLTLQEWENFFTFLRKKFWTFVKSPSTLALV
jgi:hypothetical protein